jgi:hypothetical protein
MDDDAIILALIAVLTAVTHTTCAQGSQPKLRRTKAQNRNRNRRAEATRLKKMYFAPNLHSDIDVGNTVAVSIQRPTIDKKEFSRRFDVGMQIYENFLRTQICNADNYFCQGADALGMKGASTDQNLLASLRMLCTGSAADAIVDNYGLAESTLLQCLKRFCTALLSTDFAMQQLRLPTVD